MALQKNEIFKEIKFRLPGDLDEDERKDLNGQIGDYIVTSMLDMIADGRSPVTGEDFAKLTEEYANAQKGGDTTPNMDLFGDMLNELTFEPDPYSLKIGIWDAKQAIKAYGHNTGFKGHPFLDGKVEPRKLIPGPKESFAPEIMEGVDQIIEEFLDARKDSEAIEGA